MNKWLIITSSIILLSSCNQSTKPPSQNKTLNEQSIIIKDKEDFRQTFKDLNFITSKLKNDNINLQFNKMLTVNKGSIENYLIPTNLENITINIFKNKQGTIQNISLIKTDGANIVVSDLLTGAVTVLLKNGQNTQVIKSGYTDFKPGNLTKIVSNNLNNTQKLTSLSPKDDKNVPNDLLQKRDQAKNDIRSYQEQVAIATAAVAAASAGVLVTCGATIVTLGVSTGGCLATGAALATAYITGEDKLRQLDDAKIRLDYAQKDINKWKSDHPPKK